MSVYYPNKGRGVPPSDNPPPMPTNGADAVFNCETLSKENWKKYTYAARFVEMVQTKTPKITLYTEKAKCVLMENKPDPDFEIIFYEGSYFEFFSFKLFREINIFIFQGPKLRNRGKV